MSSQKMIVQGFGTGSFYGTPTTIGLAPTSTLSITSSLVGGFHVTGLATGVQLKLTSTGNGVTGTYSILDGASGYAVLDGVSAFAVNTTTSVTLILIGI
jgi:hypothetical protein